MQVEIRHSPSFSVARCQLSPGERVRAEAGAMMATSDGVTIEAKMEGGLMRSLKRGALGGESLFMTSYSAPDGGGWVDVAARLPGALATLELTPERPYVIERGSFIAAEAGVGIDTKWKGFSSWFGGEGGFMIHASGAGTVVVSCYGAIEQMTLGPGERIVIDTGHMVAFPADAEWTMRRAVEGRSVQSIKSGEGFVFEFVGPAELLTQTRNERGLIEWLRSAIGTRD